MHNQYHVLKQNTNKRIEELEKCFNELKEKSESDSNQKDEAILNLNQKITELEVVLHAAEEDAEAQKKLSKELGSLCYIYIYTFIRFLNLIMVLFQKHDSLRNMKSNEI